MSEETQAMVVHNDRGEVSLDTVLRYADVMAKSGLFLDRRKVNGRWEDDDFETCKAKIVVRVLYGMELGLSMVSACTGVHIIEGKPSLSAGAISARIKMSGVIDYREVELTDERCELAWFENGEEIGRSMFSIADAKRAELSFRTYNGKAGNWTKYPRNMLFARALTNGQRRYCPHIFGGSVYTEEELGRSEVVEVQQNQPGRAEQRQESARDRERNEAKASLIAAVHGATDDSVQRKRIWEAIGAKVGKTSKDMTAEDFSEYAGIIRAYIDEDVLDQWVDTVLGPDVVDAEVVTTTEVVGDEGAWARANSYLHANWSAFADTHGYERKGDQYRIVHDFIRAESGMPPGCPWDDVETAAMRKVAKLLEHGDGSIARIAIATEWRDSAIERGVKLSQAQNGQHDG